LLVKLAQWQRSGFSYGRAHYNSSGLVPTLIRNCSSRLETLLTLYSSTKAFPDVAGRGETTFAGISGSGIAGSKLGAVDLASLVDVKLGLLGASW
jgi:hypothetical protein